MKDNLFEDELFKDSSNEVNEEVDIILKPDLKDENILENTFESESDVNLNENNLEQNLLNNDSNNNYWC